jgi:hypothetical protein
LKEWGRCTQGIASALAEVECLRTLDRLRMAHGFADEMIAEQREEVYRLLEAMEIVEITHPVLSRAAQPSVAWNAGRDSSLASALLWKEQAGKDLSMATHLALAIAASKQDAVSGMTGTPACDSQLIRCGRATSVRSARQGLSSFSQVQALRGCERTCSTSARSHQVERRIRPLRQIGVAARPDRAVDDEVRDVNALRGELRQALRQTPGANAHANSAALHSRRSPAPR